MRLYDLAGADGRRFSPYCWRARMALAHKGFQPEAIPTGFLGIARIGGGGETTVPVLEDADRRIRDSFAIAEYLEDTYPDRPSLFGGPGGRAAARFLESWAATLLGQISRIVLLDIHAILHAEDQPYFRTSREKRFGMALETVVADPAPRIAAFRDSLVPMRLMLKAQPFIGGAAPNYGDYILFGSLQWPRVVSPVQLLAEDDPVADWFERCLDLHGGLGRGQKAA